MNTITKTEHLIALHEELCGYAKDLMVRKNADYKAGSGDPFANFRMAKLAHVRPAQGVIVRMMDKLARWMSFIEKGELAIKEESIIDVAHDLINYTVICTGLLIEQMNAEVAKEPIEVVEVMDVIDSVKAKIAAIVGTESSSVDVATIDEAITALHAMKNYEVSKSRCRPQQS